MGLNIKNPGAEAAIRRLATMTGESLTTAVQEAVKEKIARLEETSQPRSGEELLARLRPLLNKIAAERHANNDTRTAKELQEEFYDEFGLPK
jgi:antitoxin VapB